MKYTRKDYLKGRCSHRAYYAAARQSVEGFFKTPWRVDKTHDEPRILDGNGRIVIEPSEWLSSDYTFRDTDGVWKCPIEPVLAFICEKVNGIK